MIKIRNYTEARRPSSRRADPMPMRRFISKIKLIASIINTPSNDVTLRAALDRLWIFMSNKQREGCCSLSSKTRAAYLIETGQCDYYPRVLT